MKLNAVHRKFAMPDPHDLSVVASGGNLEAIRERFGTQAQRVVAADLERRGQAREDRFAVMRQLTCLAVQTGASDHFGAEALADRLMAQANAQDRHAWGKLPNDF